MMLVHLTSNTTWRNYRYNAQEINHAYVVLEKETVGGQ